MSLSHKLVIKKVTRAVSIQVLLPVAITTQSMVDGMVHILASHGTVAFNGVLCLFLGVRIMQVSAIA